MELELSLGDSRAPAKSAFTRALTPIHAGKGEGHELVLELGVGTSNRAEQELGVGTSNRAEQDNQKTLVQAEDVPEEEEEICSYRESPVELSLVCPLLTASAENGTVNSEVCVRGFDVNTVLVDVDTAQGRSLSTSSLPLEVLVRQTADQEAEEDEESSGVGGGTRKKLRLSKEQSAFLEESFKARSTLSPKQKSDLANRLSLRPRQVEVWFQNRRARTKLKQTEVDCEYLKRCCENLVQENRRLQREVAELRAQRVSTNAAYPFYGHLPAPGFSPARVCPSYDNNKGTAHYAAISAPSSAIVTPPSAVSTTLFARPHFGPFTVHPVLRSQPSATS